MEAKIKSTIKYKTKIHNTIRNMHNIGIIELIRKEDSCASAKK